jgi:hypothetical protein
MKLQRTHILFIVLGWGVLGWRCNDGADTSDGSTTSFGVSRTMIVEDLTGEQLEDYCEWLLEKLGGADSTATCAVKDESGAPVVDPDAGVPLEITYRVPTMADCIAGAVVRYPCTAGAVEDCFESYTHDWCAADQRETKECEPLNACLAEPPPNNGSTCPTCSSFVCSCENNASKLFCQEDQTTPCPGNSARECPAPCP